jgi:hypothetical protein
MLNNGPVLVLGYIVLETRAENTKKVTAWHNKQKGTTRKQDISEDLQEFVGSETSEGKNSTFPAFFGRSECRTTT